MANGEGKTYWGLPVALIVYTLGAGVAVVSWGIHVEQILSAREVTLVSLDRRTTRNEIALDAIDKTLRISQERVDRLDTPLSKIVEQMDHRLQALSERSIQQEGRIQGLVADLKRLDTRR